MAASSSTVIAERYAKALFALAKEAKMEAGVDADLNTLAEAAREEPTVRDFLQNPLLPRPVKAKALEEVLVRGKAAELTRRFTQRLALAGRLSVLPAIARAYSALLAEAQGEMVVKAEVAQTLSASAQKELTQALSRRYGKTVRLQISENPALIGGMVLYAGDMRMDYSVAGQMARLKDTLKKAPLSKAA